MLEILKKFEHKAPEIVFEWHDAETGAEGWMVINSLRGGSAGGGTRMRKGLDRNEVLSLAKTMEIKFAVAGPPIGGAKSGINFDPADPRKQEVLRRWYKALMPILKTYYGTGGDLNVDEVKEVIHITREYGLEHPQEGTLMGHYHPQGEEKKQLIRQLQEGVSLRLTDPRYTPAPQGHYLVADMITGWGVSEAVRHFYRLWHKTDLKGKKCIIQGWGNVASAAAYYLAQEGALIVGIIDRAGGMLKPEGFTFDEVKFLFETKKENALSHRDMLSYEETQKRFWDMGADIFVPGAASRLVSKDDLAKMQGKVEVLSCGANVPFRDPEIFYGETSAYADKHFAVIPDFIANCGMARTFAYLMLKEARLEDEAIFQDVSDTIGNALEELYKRMPDNRYLMEAAYEMVLRKLV